MKSWFYLLCIGCCLSCQSLLAQNFFRHSLSFRFDNEAITDQYYSSGLELSLRWVPGRKVADNLAAQGTGKPHSQWLIGMHYGNQLYTPSNVSEEAYLTHQQDRPYAGWQYFRIDLQTTTKPDLLHRFGLELGWVGPGSGMGAFHVRWHQWLNIWKPWGWDRQIANEPTANLLFSRIKEWRKGPFWGFLSETRLDLGNRLSQLSQDFAVRLGHINPLARSNLCFQPLGDQLLSSQQKESFFLAGSRLHWVWHNLFIQGSLFDNPSPFTAEGLSWYWDHHVGFHLSGRRWLFSLNGHYLSPEIRAGKSHLYLSYLLAYRW